MKTGRYLAANSYWGGGSSPQSQAKLCAAKQALILSGKDQVLLTDSETLSSKTTTAMAYSAPGRYAGVLQALEALRVDLDTAPLPELLALVRSIDSDLADRATAEAWDRDRLIITMRDEGLPPAQRGDAPIPAQAPATLGPFTSDNKDNVSGMTPAPAPAPIMGSPLSPRRSRSLSPPTQQGFAATNASRQATDGAIHKGKYGHNSLAGQPRRLRVGVTVESKRGS